MTVIRAAGDAALLIEAEDLSVVHGLTSAIATERIRGVADIIPGAGTVLVVTEPGSWELGALAARLRGVLGGAKRRTPRQIPRGVLGGRTPRQAPRGLMPHEHPAAARTPVTEIPVSYDGPDLAEVARLAGLTVADVIARHSAAEYTVGWLGFSPGFGYLTGLDPALHLPRLAAPRIRVPAGSVAIAGPFAAVYPSASPGGWRLLGRSPARLWDPAREPPALLAPGMRVRFRPVSALPAPPSAFPPPAPTPPTPAPTDSPIPSAQPSPPDPPIHQASTPATPAPTGSWQQGSEGRGSLAGGREAAGIEVIRAGVLATVQDLGRPGYGHLGVPRSGAADAASLRLANRLVGNPEGAAGIELTLGGAVLRFGAGAWIAVTGARSTVRVSSPPADTPRAGDPRAGDPQAGPARVRVVGLDAPFYVPDGGELTVAVPVAGLRGYVAVRGGIGVPPVLGSRSSDALSGLGPAPLRPGDLLPLASAADCRDIAADLAPLPAMPSASPGGTELRVLPGPREDWFGKEALGILCGAPYQVTAASDRAGLRLDGPAIPRCRDGELPSEGMVTGALQVPPDGRPILFLADHPVTGGYPVIAVIASADIGPAAQLRPGDPVRFRAMRGTSLHDRHPPTT